MSRSKCLHILELSPDANAQQIKAAYRDLAKVWHPDRFEHDIKLQYRAQEKLKQINMAYEWLCEHPQDFEGTQEQTFTSHPTSEPTPNPVHDAEASPPLRDFSPSGPQARPWVRYWARLIDNMLFVFLFGLVLSFVCPSVLEMNDILFGIMSTFVYVFVEPCMLSSWGTTPGKALLNFQLRKQDGAKPGYADALSRAFNVWIRGLGLAIPIISLVTHLRAYDILKKQGVTSWDKDGGFRITHKLVGAARVLAVIAIFIAFGYLMILGKEME
jgi:uncharacterized RDD family membrane protein YckC